jgi:hypothetical protein
MHKYLDNMIKQYVKTYETGEANHSEYLYNMSLVHNISEHNKRQYESFNQDVK